MILGIPNVGKSTLINTICGKSIAKVGNRPAVTQHQARIKAAKDFILLDTPGFLWPRLDPPVCGSRLAVTGAIKDAVLDLDEIAFFAARYMIARYPAGVAAQYKLDEVPAEPYELLEHIGRERGDAAFARGEITHQGKGYLRGRRRGAPACRRTGTSGPA